MWYLYSSSEAIKLTLVDLNSFVTTCAASRIQRSTTGYTISLQLYYKSKMHCHVEKERQLLRAGIALGPFSTLQPRRC